MDVKESDHQYLNFFLPSHIPMQSNSQVAQGPINGVIAPTLQQIYSGDEKMINTGVSSSKNPVAVSQIQIPLAIEEQLIQSEVPRSNYPSEQQQGQCLYSEKWLNDNYTNQCVANDAISKGF